MTHVRLVVSQPSFDPPQPAMVETLTSLGFESELANVTYYDPGPVLFRWWHCRCREHRVYLPDNRPFGFKPRERAALTRMLECDCMGAQ